MDAGAPNPGAAKLFRESGPPAKVGRLEEVGERFVRGLRDALHGLRFTQVNVRADDHTIGTFAEWRQESGGKMAFCCFGIEPLRGPMILALPPALILAIVDAFYGGTGEAYSERNTLSPAETRFVSRFADQVGVTLAAAWSPVLALKVDLQSIDANFEGMAGFPDATFLAIQPFKVSAGSGQEWTVTCLYPAEALRAVEAPPTSQAKAAPSAADQAWQDQLTNSVMNVHLPLRTIFARPELPLSQLLGLQPGDVIPLCLPDVIPVTVCGRMFATATVGEARGRTAIRIEKIEEGISGDE